MCSLSMHAVHLLWSICSLLTCDWHLCEQMDYAKACDSACRTGNRVFADLFNREVPACWMVINGQVSLQGCCEFHGSSSHHAKTRLTSAMLCRMQWCACLLTAPARLSVHQHHLGLAADTLIAPCCRCTHCSLQHSRCACLLALPG